MRLAEFKKRWVGRKIICHDTGTVVELTDEMVQPRAFIPVGKGAVDLGDGFYARWLGKVRPIEGLDGE